MRYRYHNVEAKEKCVWLCWWSVWLVGWSVWCCLGVVPVCGNFSVSLRLPLRIDRSANHHPGAGCVARQWLVFVRRVLFLFWHRNWLWCMQHRQRSAPHTDRPVNTYFGSLVGRLVGWLVFNERSSTMSGRGGRFNLLLLEDGEYYLEDVIVSSAPIPPCLLYTSPSPRDRG